MAKYRPVASACVVVAMIGTSRSRAVTRKSICVMSTFDRVDTDIYNGRSQRRSIEWSNILSCMAVNEIQDSTSLN